MTFKKIELYPAIQPTKKELHLIKQYEQINGYVKEYKKQLFGGVNPDSQEGLVNTDLKTQRKGASGFIDKAIKLDNIEVYNTNILNDFCSLLEMDILPIAKSKQQKELSKTFEHRIKTKRVLKNGIELKMNGTDTRTPLEYVNDKIQSELYQQELISNQGLIVEAKKQLAYIKKNRANTAYKKVEDIKTVLTDKLAIYN